MSIVKYHNSKTGRTLVYESVPHYDPISKQNRPKRKYLGYERSDSHEFVPSSGKRGRPPMIKPQEEHLSDINKPDYEALYKQAASAVVEQEKQLSLLQADIRQLQEENKRLVRKMKEYEHTIQAVHTLTARHFENGSQQK